MIGVQSFTVNVDIVENGYVVQLVNSDEEVIRSAVFATAYVMAQWIEKAMPLPSGHFEPAPVELVESKEIS